MTTVPSESGVCEFAESGVYLRVQFGINLWSLLEFILVVSFSVCENSTGIFIAGLARVIQDHCYSH